MKQTIEIDDDKVPSAAPDEMVPVGLDGLLGATEKVLGMNRGLLEQDHRDSITNKRLSTPADLMAERVKLDVGGVLKKMVFGAAKRRSLASFSPGGLTPLVESHLIGSPLASALEQINPVDEMNQARRVTLMGPGGIGSSDQVTSNMQAVDVGAFGFMSPVEGPECFRGDHEVRTKHGWKFWSDVTMADELACQIDGRLEWHKPARLIRDHYKGDMILGEHESIRMCVTPNHRVFYKTEHTSKNWKVDAAENMAGRAIYIPIRHLPQLGNETLKYVTLPTGGGRLDVCDWAEFLGWWLAEGSHGGSSSEEHRSVRVHQCPVANPAKHTKIKELMLRLGFITGRGKHRNTSFTTSKQHVRAYFAQWKNGCYDKWIPEECFMWPVAARERMLEALLLGDGRYNKKRICYCSVSLLLAQSVERLAISLGYPAFIREEPDKREHVKTTNYVVSISRAKSRMLKARVNKHKNGKTYGSYWKKVPHDDLVYCASVPGGMLLVRGKPGTAGFWTGNSENAGIDTRLADKVKIGSNGRLYQLFRNPKTGNLHWLSPEDLVGRTVGLPK